eukprot:TRINITY_DN6634_c0_g1_i1.p1 TRINITY_DN6634_c0_g1~~TRINITY_DN6634_c0_g1_i1.p1  ORF type:complete len:726 (+),score=101.30 TRINITY_DN6634_c0_g1_i1:36-2180(+)
MESLQERFYEIGRNVMRRKTVKRDPPETLNKVLGWPALVMLGLGSIIGAGIFVLSGVAAREKSGPSITISFLLDGLVCVLSALTYAECASRVPLTGSAYVYAYITIGELPSFLIGWALSLEYGFSVSSVARGWSGYVRNLVTSLTGQIIPTWLYRIAPAEGIEIDLIAGLAVLGITFYIFLGMKSSAMMNNIVTGIAVLVVSFVIGYGAFFVDPNNWTDDFAPFGTVGVLRGASFVFFAYVGFDCLANFGEETKNPTFDIPMGIVGSLGISTLLYVLVALVLTGMVPYHALDIHAPLAVAFGSHGVAWASILISIGALAALTTSMLVSLLGQARILFAMSRDGLFPSYFGRLDVSTREPARAQILTGAFCFFLAVFLDIEKLSELVSMGTLSAFTIVNLSVLILRNRDFREWERTRRTIQLMEEGIEEISEKPLHEQAWDLLVDPRAFGFHVLIFVLYVSVSSFLAAVGQTVAAIVFGCLAIVPFIMLHVYFWLSTRKIQAQPQKVDEEGEKDRVKEDSDEVNLSEEEEIRKKEEENGSDTGAGIGLDCDSISSSPAATPEASPTSTTNTTNSTDTTSTTDTTTESTATNSLDVTHHHHHHETIHERKDYFRTPLCPTIPLLGMAANIFLLCQIEWITWALFGGWMCIAGLIYLAYGYKHSKEWSPDLISETSAGSGKLPHGPSGMMDEDDSSSFDYDYSMDYGSSSEGENLDA